MPSYTVASCTVENPDVHTRFGPMIAYKLAFTDHSYAEILQKPETPAPEVGDVLEGHIEESEWGPKFKRDRSNGARQSQPRPLPATPQAAGIPAPQESYQDARGTRIEAQSARRDALHFCEIKQRMGELPENFGIQHVRQTMKWMNSLLDPEDDSADIPF
jgi:hypothetical protein